MEIPSSRLILHPEPRPRLQHAYAAHPRHILFCLRLPATTCYKHDQGKDYQNIFSHITHHSFVFIISFLHGKSKKISKLDTFLSEIRNEYLLESVQIVLFRIGAKTIIFRKLSPLPRLFAIQKSIILRKQCGNGENNAKTLLSYNYFLRFSNQIFTDFWPQATPSIGRSVRLRETMKARYKANVIHCKSAQIRAIRGDPPAQEAIMPEFFRWFCFDI